MGFGLDGAALAALVSGYTAAAGTAVNQVVSKQRADASRSRTAAAAETAATLKATEKRKAGEDMREAKGEDIDPTAILQAEEDQIGAMQRSNLGSIDPNQLKLGMNALLGEGGNYA